MVALTTGACANLPRETPLAVSPIKFGERELRDVNNVFIVTDASSSMRKEGTFAMANSLAISFIMALPEASERSSSKQYNAGYLAFGGTKRVSVPLDPFRREALLNAAYNTELLGSPFGTGGTTPLHTVFDEIGAQIIGETRRTAIVLFTDGVTRKPEKALAAARSLIHDGTVCVHAVQVGNDSAGTRFLGRLGNITPCSSAQNSAGIAIAGDFERYAKSVMVGDAPLPPVAAAPPASCASKIRLRGIEFGFDKANVDEAGTAVLDAAIAVLSSCSSANLNVDGYTDSIGADAYNQGLSERRANAVADYFAKKGIESDRVASRGFGRANPVASNDTKDGRARNRRVEISARD
jgi:OOP family OmpA-OmpF porin